jgi:hypothetical protein
MSKKSKKAKLWHILEKFGVWQTYKFEFMSREIRDKMFDEIYELFEGKRGKLP